MRMLKKIEATNCEIYINNIVISQIQSVNIYSATTLCTSHRCVYYITPCIRRDGKQCKADSVFRKVESKGKNR